MTDEAGRSRFRCPLAGLGIAVVVLLLIPSMAGNPSPRGVGSRTEGGGQGHLTIASGAGSPAAMGTHPFVSCANRTQAFQAQDGAWMTRSVRFDLQTGGCPIGHDEPLLNFLSNWSGSGARVEFDVTLPGPGVSAAQVLGSYWVGISVASSRCSLDGVSYLEVQLRPPESSIGGAPMPNWTLQAPIFTLVPAGSCDPRCTNDTAAFVVLGRPYCEENAVVSGVGSFRPSGWASFGLGDRLSVTFSGVARSASSLTVFVNDSTHPRASLSWTYAGSSTISGEPVVPISDRSIGVPGWGSGSDVVAGWWTCPTQTGPATCNSYDGPLVSSVGVPMLTRVTFFDPLYGQSYDYPKLAASSSSGGCSGRPNVVACPDFATYGGTGQYPYWSLHGAHRAAWYTLGGAYADLATDYGQAASQFDPAGVNATPIPAGAVYGANVTAAAVNSTTSNVTLRFRVADPSGVDYTPTESYWCFAGGSPSPKGLQGTLDPGSSNSIFDGNWSTTGFDVLGSGTLYAAFYETDFLFIQSPPVAASIALTGTGSTCAFGSPSTPTFGAGGAVPLAGGYRVNWSEASYGVTNYTVWATPVPSSGAARAFPVGDVNATVLNLTASAANFNLQVVATNIAGLSTFSPIVVPPATLPVQSADVTTPGPSTLWTPNATAQFTARLTNSTSAEAPFVYTLFFGDGSMDVLGSPNTSVSIGHTFPGAYFGDAAVAVQVADALGDLVASPPLVLPVLATPLAVPSNISAGNGTVEVGWGVARSPAAPVTHYTVFFTSNASSATFLTANWPSNNTAPFNGSIYNSTAGTLTFSAPIGAAVHAQVVAWNRYGMGSLPSGDPPPQLLAVPAPLSVGAIQGAFGGRAPVTDVLSSLVTGGTNTQLTQAVYSFDSVQPYPTTVVPFPGATNAFWVNATYTFTSPGVHLVVLHAASALGDVGIATDYVFVGIGLAPQVNASEAPGPHWVGSAVAFVARASGVGPFAFNWTFGDGTTGSGPTPSHVYTSAGTFSAVAQVTDLGTGGITTDTTLVVVFALPTVAIVTTAGPNASYSYTFTADAAGGSGTPVVSWVFGDGIVGHGLTTHHDYAGPGTYVVNVSTTDPTGKGASASITLVVPATGSNPAPGPLSGTSGLIVGGLSVVLVVVAGTLTALWLGARRRAEEAETARPESEPKDAEWRDAP